MILDLCLELSLLLFFLPFLGFNGGRVMPGLSSSVSSLLNYEGPIERPLDLVVLDLPLEAGLLKPMREPVADFPSVDG